MAHRPDRFAQRRRRAAALGRSERADRRHRPGRGPGLDGRGVCAAARRPTARREKGAARRRRIRRPKLDLRHALPQGDEKQRCKLPDLRLERLRRLMDDDVSIERAWHKIDPNDRAAASTVEALKFSLRDGIHALIAPATLERLSKLDERQLSEVAERVQNFRQAIASAWTPDEVKALVRIWGESHE